MKPPPRCELRLKSGRRPGCWAAGGCPRFGQRCLCATLSVPAPSMGDFPRMDSSRPASQPFTGSRGPIENPSRRRLVTPLRPSRPRTGMMFAMVLWLAVDVRVAAAQTTLADWDLICFCNSRVSTPHFVVKMEANGAILYAARNGMTRDQLARSGVPATNTAIQLLLDWGLLAQQGDTLKTAFPVLDADRMTAFRRDLRAAATAMLPRLRPSVDSISAT